MTAYASYGMMLLSAFFVPFKARNLSIALPKTLRTVRLGYLGIAMSALMMFSNFGNQLAERYQGSTFHQVVESADSYIYDQQPDPGSSADADQKIEKRRKMIAAGSCALAVFLIVLLILTTCGGVCLIIFAVGGAWPTALGTVAAIVGGALVAGFSIFGIVKAVQMC
jgi:uncharacterized integral membrane protein